MYLHNGFEVEDGVDTPVKAIETLSSEVSSDAKGGVSLFNGFNNGGFFEWYGYRVIMDPRPELWAPSITSSEVDYAREYVSYMDRELAASDIVDEYDFDYILTRDNEPMDEFLSQDQELYRVLAKGEGYLFWKRVSP